MANCNIGVLGATSLVGYAILPLLSKMNFKVIAFSRNLDENATNFHEKNNVYWVQFGESLSKVSHYESSNGNKKEIPQWICLAPIWVLPDYYDWLKSLGAKRIIVLSSTSRFTKIASDNESETDIVKKLADGEDKLIQWANENDIEWVILRPTLIYGGGKDKNLSIIARFVRRFGFFPLFGNGMGMRQPVHVEDVAKACYQVLNQSSVSNQAYNISGGETFTYREMVKRVFETLDKKPRFLNLPLSLLKIGLMTLKIIPRYRGLTSEMIARMGQDMVFEHDAASQDFGFSPRPFELKKEDLVSK